MMKQSKKAFHTLNGMSALGDNPDLKTAKTAYDKFMNLNNEVIRLSRLNTNIKSAELSLGKKTTNFSTMPGNPGDTTEDSPNPGELFTSSFEKSFLITSNWYGKPIK